jgi:hypothetical protein
MVQQDRASWCMATAEMVHAFRADGALSFYCHYVGVCLPLCLFIVIFLAIKTDRIPSAKFTD